MCRLVLNLDIIILGDGDKIFVDTVYKTFDMPP